MKVDKAKNNRMHYFVELNTDWAAPNSCRIGTLRKTTSAANIHATLAQHRLLRSIHALRWNSQSHTLRSMPFHFGFPLRLEKSVQMGDPRCLCIFSIFEWNTDFVSQEFEIKIFDMNYSQDEFIRNLLWMDFKSFKLELHKQNYA